MMIGYTPGAVTPTIHNTPADVALNQASGLSPLSYLRNSVVVHVHPLSSVANIHIQL